MRKLILAILLFALCLGLQQGPVKARTLSTNSRWIVGEDGRRVKLTCGNWITHLKPMLAEGLNLQPVDTISQTIAAMGFNCVRLTWPLYLATNETMASVTIQESFESLNLPEALAGIKANNPSFLNLTRLEAYQAVVDSLGRHNVMVIADNHVTVPGWCCSNTDENGFFGDKYFDPKLWVKGLTKMATVLKAHPNVVGMSLRNELRGPRQNAPDWYRYMTEGAEAVHAANPKVLVILSGLSFDNDLSFLHQKQVKLSFTGKLVYELHWYGFSSGNAWEDGNPNKVCGQVRGEFDNKAGFLLKEGYPLFLSEFGVDNRGVSENDNRYYNCFAAWAMDNDVDWALWAIMGSYYFRQGLYGPDETYGALDWSWSGLRNATYFKRIAVLQPTLQGPGLPKALEHKILFHPSTGLCVVRTRSILEPFALGPCPVATAWKHDSSNTLTMAGSALCMRAAEIEVPAKIGLGIGCHDNSSKWEEVSESKLHLSTELSSGKKVCLDVNPINKVIVTKPCKCMNDDKTCDPTSQWFKIISSNYHL